MYNQMLQTPVVNYMVTTVLSLWSYQYIERHVKGAEVRMGSSKPVGFSVSFACLQIQAAQLDP